MTSAIDYKAQAREFAEWLVNLQGKGRRKWFNQAVVRGNCPRPEHDDGHPSFSFNFEMDAFACSCSRGKGSELREALGWKPSTAAADFPRPAAAFTRGAPPNRPPDDIYRYANGNRKLKWRVPGQKSHSFWRHESGKNGMQGSPGLYRLEEAAAAAKTLALIHVSESESDADALADLGLVAIATPHGASSPWKEVPTELAGGRLVVWEHQDDAGRKYAAAIVDVAKKAGCDAAIVQPAAPHKDVRDWILAGATAEELVALARPALHGFPMAEPADDLLAADLPPPDYVINPIAIRENLTLIQGEPKAGKSVITLYLAACASLGIWPAGRWTVPRPVRVLYVTWEDGRRRIQKRLRMFLDGLGEPFARIKACPKLAFYSKSKGPFKAPRIRLEEPAGRMLLKKIILYHEAELVVLDTLSHLTAVDENAKEKMQPVMDALTDLTEETGAAIILNHHTGKEGKQNAKSTTYKSRGSSVIPAAPDVILHLGDRGKTNMTPCRTISREDDGDEFVLEYLPEGKEIVRFRLVDEAEEEGEGGAGKYGSQKLIIETLTTITLKQPWGALTWDLVRETKLTRSTVQRVLKRLVDEDLIQRQKVETNGGEAWAYANLSHAFQPKDGGSPGGPN